MFPVHQSQMILKAKYTELYNKRWTTDNPTPSTVRYRSWSMELHFILNFFAISSCIHSSLRVKKVYRIFQHRPLGLENRAARLQISMYYPSSWLFSCTILFSLANLHVTRHQFDSYWQLYYYMNTSLGFIFAQLYLDLCQFLASSNSCMKLELACKIKHWCTPQR